MTSLVITSLVGVGPFTVTLCDITNTYCYIVATNVTTTPLLVNIPIQLTNVQQILVNVTDSYNCVDLQLYSCPEPTPTSTIPLQKL